MTAPIYTIYTAIWTTGTTFPWTWWFWVYIYKVDIVKYSKHCSQRILSRIERFHHCCSQDKAQGEVGTWNRYLEMSWCLEELLETLLLLLSLHAVVCRIGQSNQVLGRDYKAIEEIYYCASYYLYELLIRHTEGQCVWWTELRFGNIYSNSLMSISICKQ